MTSKINKILFIYFLLILAGCSKKSSIEPETSSTKLNDKKINNLNSDSLSTIQNNNFFKLEKSMQDIQNEMQILKNKVMNYEYTPKQQDNYTEKLKLLIDSPPATHRISMKNGSIINGIIEEDKIDIILISTEVGKLRLNKSNILGIENIILPIPELLFIGNGQEEISNSYRLFTGKVMNQGNRRADFVRIIYNLWTDDTQLAATDSTFINGSQFIYRSGIITDTVLEPNESARFNFKVSVPDSVSVSYVTREIRWEMFD